MSDEMTQNPATATPVEPSSTPADDTQAQPVVETAPEAAPAVEEEKAEQTA